MIPFRKLLGFTSLCVILVLATSVRAGAQTTGKIEGTVFDQNGAPLPGVTVGVSSPNLQGDRTAVTGSDGRYHLSSLPPGTYKVTATLTGLGSVEKSASVALDATATVNLQMQLTAKEAVTVTGELPLLDATSTTGGTSYTSQVMEKLPVGRNYASIIQSNPGVSSDQGDTQGRALALTVYGATSVENQFIIDGINTTNVIRGFQGKAINGEFIQEVEIKTGGYQAEYGRALGGVINVITKSGGNDFHGDGFVYYDSFGMRANQVINGADISNGIRINGYNRTDFGADLGGRIIKDKLWFFAAYDRISRPQDVSRFNSSALVSKDDKFPTDATDNLYSGKLTWNIASGTTLVGTAFSDPSKVTGAGASDPTHVFQPNLVPLVNPEPSTWGADLAIGGTDYGLRLNQLFGSKGLMTLQGSRHYDRYRTTPSAAGDSIQNQDFTCAGGTPANPCDFPVEPNAVTGGFGQVTGYFQNNYSTRNQARGDMSFYFGNNELKIGGDWQDNKTTAITHISGLQQVQQYNEKGQTYYAHNFWAANTNNLVPVDNVVVPHTYDQSVYLQDSWKILPGLTLNAGLRYDREDLRNYANQNVITLNNEWQPRVGVVWDPSNDGSMKVYAFGGRFYYAMPTDLNVRSYGQQVFAITYNFDPVDVTQNPNVLGHETPAIQGGVFAEPHDAGMKGIYQDELSVGIEKLIDPSFSIGIKGEYRKFGRAIEDRCDGDSAGPDTAGNSCAITNPGGSGVFAGGQFTGCNGLDGDAKECGIKPINSLLPAGTPTSAKRLYRGIEFVVKKTFTDKLWLQASYVYSSLRGNYDGEVKEDYQQTDPGITADFDYASFLRNRYGRLYLDRPSIFRLDTTYVTPFKLSIGLQAYAQSGAPLSTYGFFNSLYGAQVSLVKNGYAGRLSTNYDGNLSLGYPISVGPVTVTAQLYIFNILNQQTITNVDTRLQLSQGVNYPKTPDQYNQLFYPPCTAAQAGDPVANKCNEQNNANYLKARARQDPRLFKAALKISF
jgi:hypothetical protein